MGRGALGQSVRFAATLWVGPIVMIVGASLGIIGIFVGGLAGLFLIVGAADAAETAIKSRGARSDGRRCRCSSPARPTGSPSARVPVVRLQLPAHKHDADAIVLAEAEGDERASLGIVAVTVGTRAPAPAPTWTQRV